MKYIQMIKNEYNLLQLVKHPNVVEILEVFQQPDRTIIVMEYISSGDLY